MTYGPPAFIGGNVTLQVLSGAATVSCFLPDNDTFTLSPGSALPHIFNGTPRCNTTPSDSTDGIRTSAYTSPQASATNAAPAIPILNLILYINLSRLNQGSREGLTIYSLCAILRLSWLLPISLWAYFPYPPAAVSLPLPTSSYTLLAYSPYNS